MNLISTILVVRRAAAPRSSAPRPSTGCATSASLTWKRSPGWHRSAPQPCPACGGPVCADCGKALIVLAPRPGWPTPPGR